MFDCSEYVLSFVPLAFKPSLSPFRSLPSFSLSSHTPPKLTSLYPRSSCPQNVASFSLLPGKEYVDLLKFNVPLLTAEVRVQNSNEKAEGEGGESRSSRAGAAVSAKMEAKEAVVGM